MTTSPSPRVGLALGSGSARGWAHIGVIRALDDVGVRPDIVCGTSIGALVGAAYAAGELDRLEAWVLGLGMRNVLGFMDPGLGGGMLKGERLMEFFRRSWPDRLIEELAVPFGAVATSLRTGAEIWLRHGSTLDAVRASISLPGIFAPVSQEGTQLVDGGLVNPVPVSLARAMGADVVIAVDLGSDILGRRFRAADEPAGLSLVDVLSTCMDIVQVRIARSRMAGEPPEVVITPRLGHLRLLDFHRAVEAIGEGREATRRAADGLSTLLVRGS